ncbi:hypothetical protein PVAP13_6NG002350 [Panicum virgatum]|uniref:Uncharacterized protein n=1 Tax=Panicum virgatum TaxID=38727 RepID=A0A8T0QST9_PANVG|nr:hypothetical protein PVAP13_6NG002350 [Panicum virgatum]
MDEQPPILFGVPLLFKKRKAGDLIDGIPVLESTPVTPPDVESQTASPESPPVPPSELAEPLTLRKIPAPDPGFLVKEPLEEAPASLPSVDSPKGPPPSPSSTNGPALEELLGTLAASPLWKLARGSQVSPLPARKKRRKTPSSRLSQCERSSSSAPGIRPQMKSPVPSKAAWSTVSCTQCPSYTWVVEFLLCFV